MSLWVNCFLRKKKLITGLTRPTLMARPSRPWYFKIKFVLFSYIGLLCLLVLICQKLVYSANFAIGPRSKITNFVGVYKSIHALFWSYDLHFTALILSIWYIWFRKEWKVFQSQRLHNGGFQLLDLMLWA